MLQFDKNGKASLYPHKIKYTRDNDTHEQWALPNKEWWTEFEQKWDDMSIIEFTEVELTPEQLQRFESIEDSIVEGYGFDEYILNGEFPKGIIGIPQSIQPQIQEKQQLLMQEEDEEKRKEIREEIQAMIPSPSLEEMLDFVQENFKK